jgi:polyisoprenoid-binding protein YceI
LTELVKWGIVPIEGSTNNAEVIMGLFSKRESETTENIAESSVAVSDISGDYVLDPSHTTIGFTARHAMVTKVRGHFSQFEGTAHVDTSNPANSSVKVVIEAASVTTGNEQRDGHLRTPDFFDIENHPTMTFTSTGLEGSGSDYKLHGDLTLKGVTRPVTFDLEVGGVAKDPWGNTKAGFTASTTVNRKDFGLTYNAALETGGVLIGDKVTIELDIEAALKS